MSGDQRPLPLADVTVLALEQFGAGPFGSLHLADLGATVIKIEDPASGGDVGRSTVPYAADGDSPFFQSFNRNKKSIALDLQNPSGRRVFEDLVRRADAVYSNLRGDVPAKLKIMYDDLKHLNPAIVCCSLSGFGMTGSRAKQPGYDYLLQGLAGWQAVTGEPDGPPTKSGLSMVDFSGGVVAAVSLLSGVHAARRDGVGMDCDVSLYDTAISMLNYMAAWNLNHGFEPARRHNSAHQTVVPFQNFQTADSWIVIACAKEKFWQRLAVVLDEPDWVGDDTFGNFTARRENEEVVLAALDAKFKTKTTEEWLKMLVPRGIPAAPIYSVPEALNDPSIEERELIVRTAHPTLGDVRTVATGSRVGPVRHDHQPGPALGGNTEEIAADLLGYDAANIARLHSEGAFGAPV